MLRYFSGILRLMQGKRDGLQRLNLSADGFWASFGAIIVSLPPMALSWVEFETVERQWPFIGSGVGAYAAHALADVTAWILPLLILIMAARHIGLRRKIGPIVIALNWSGALLAWALVPLWLLMLLTGGNMAVAFLLLLAGVATLVLTTRVVVFAGDCDYLVAGAITALLVVCSILTYAAVMDVTGIKLM
ncbi:MULTISPECIES: hypothetical protein [Aureimonas]|uniref:hypothetical protein n=1 Tax=Aureimonas TaxID=414371 RepID=UPI001FEEEC2D|nr:MULTISPECIES: hypothetical protein [Aureimonas]